MVSLPPKHIQRAAFNRHHSAVAAVTYGEITFRNSAFENVAITRRGGDLRGEEGGLLDATELTIRIAKHRISLRPKANELLTIGEVTWKIDRVSGDLAWEQEWILYVSKQ